MRCLRRSFQSLAVVPFLLAGCQPQPSVQVFSGVQQGTTYQIKLVMASSSPSRSEIEALIKELFDKIDLMLSTYRDDSEISRFNQLKNLEWVPVSQGLAQLTALASEVSEKTGGCFDPTIKPLFDLWGFSKSGPQRRPEDADVRRVLTHVGMSKVEVDLAGSRLRKHDPEVALDLSSIGQGYTVAEIARAFEAKGLTDYLIEVGGELKVRGVKPDGSHWRVAVEKPTPMSATVQGLLDVRETQGTAIMTAGTYRHFFEQEGEVFSHVLDPRIGGPVKHHLLSVTVLHEDPTLADLWDTALLCVGEADAQRLATAEELKVLLISDHSHELVEWTSPAFEGQEVTGVQLIHPADPMED